MALNKLKKWIGTQAMTAFFDQLNDNVDATNAAIDAVENTSLRTPISFTPDPDITVIRNSSYIQNSIAYVNLLVEKSTPFPIGQTKIGSLSDVTSAARTALSGISIHGTTGATGSDGAILWTGGSVFVHPKVSNFERFAVTGSFCL